MYALGLDPGGTSGFAWVRLKDDKLVLINAGMVSENGYFDWLDSWTDYSLQLEKDPDERIFVAIEDFIKRPDKGNNDWLELPVPKQIGAAQYRAYQLGWRCVLQQPSNKAVGYRLANLTYVKGKAGQHTSDAIAHAAYFLRNGISATTKQAQLKRQYARRR